MATNVATTAPGITPMQGAGITPENTPLQAGAGKDGGPIGAEKSGGGPGAGAMVGMASTALDLGKTAFGPTGIDTSGKTAAPETQSRGM